MQEFPLWLSHIKPVSMRTQVQSLAPLSELRILRYHELKSQMAQILRCCGCGVGRQRQLNFSPKPGNFPYTASAALSKKQRMHIKSFAPKNIINK